MNQKTKKPRADGQLTGLAGELFVAAELLRWGLQTSVTFGNAKAIDLLTHNPNTGENFNVQVKALRKKNYFPINKKNYFPIKPSLEASGTLIYVFVLLNEPGQQPQYFIVPSKVLAEDQARFGKDFQHPTFPGIHPKMLGDFEGAWHYFGVKKLENMKKRAK